MSSDLGTRKRNLSNIPCPARYPSLHRVDGEPITVFPSRGTEKAKPTVSSGIVRALHWQGPLSLSPPAQQSCRKAVTPHCCRWFFQAHSEQETHSKQTAGGEPRCTAQGPFPSTITEACPSLQYCISTEHQLCETLGGLLKRSLWSEICCRTFQNL